MNKIISILLILLGSIQAKSQTNDYLPKVVPPAPTSSVFRQYGEHQPSLATGMINIPIPLFEIKDGDFSLPFSLIYSTSGIKVSDYPVPAGYGWIFSPGLRITRTILGRADDYFPLRFGDIGDSFSSLQPGILSEHNSYLGVFNIPRDSLYDSQQDIFTIHLPSGNYTFFIENMNNTYNIKTAGNLLKIEPISDADNSSLRPIYGFKITDENGILYTFGKTTLNSNDAYTEVPSNEGYATSWMLREIKLPNNSIISFTWDKALTSEFTPTLYSSISIKDNKNIGEKPDPEISDIGGASVPSDYPFTAILAKITFSGGTVSLNYTDTYYNNKQFLSSIIVKNNSGGIVKNIGFYYGKERTLAAYLLAGLKIDKEVYKFTYNSQTFSKGSTGLDYWGFYNGNETNSNLIPKVYLRLFNKFGDSGAHAADLYQWIGYADRSVSPEHMKAFMLSRIDYPTGGYSEFEYEPHRFSNQIPLSTYVFVDNFITPINQGGGLRVTKITTKASSDETAIVKTYKYGENENGLANISHVPTLDTFLEEVGACDAYSQEGYPLVRDPQRYRSLQVNAYSNYSKYIINQTPIWYSKVTEYTNEYKTESFFNYTNDQKNPYLEYRAVYMQYISYYSSLFQDGPRFISQIKYKNNGQAYTPVETISTIYSEIDGGPIDNNIIKRAVILTDNRGDASEWGRNPDFYSRYQFFAAECPYRLIPYKIGMIYYTMMSKQTSVLSGDAFITTTEDYEYDTPVLLKKITKTTSENNRSIVTTMKYPGDYLSSPYNAMVSKNILAPVIEKTSYMKDKVTGSLKELNKVQTNYSLFNNSIYKPSSIQTSTGGGNLETEVTFNNYDIKGNLKQMTTKDGKSSYYLWSYNGQYPIAEINNVSNLESTESAIKEVFGNISNINTITDKPYLNYSDTVCLRNLRNHNNLKPFFINSYVYKPLVGVTSITDQSGLTTTYNYDDAGRLISIIDGNNKTLSSYSYQYKGPTFSDISLSFPVESSYDITSNPNLYKTFTAITSGGSAQGFTYKWIHQLPTGGTSTAIGNPASFYLNSLGTNTLTCIAEDVLSGKTKEFTKSFKVSEATSFKNIQISNSSGSWTRTANANVYCENDGVITFNIYCSKSNPDTRMYIKLGYNDLIEVTDYTYNSTVRANFSAGITYVNLTIEGDDPSATIELQMTSITNNRLGGTTNLWITPN
ncbi:RHS repeat domain-containing protein [Dysgonomonas sp.]